MVTDTIYRKRPWLKFYRPEVPPDVDIPEQSVVETFDAATERWRDKTALVFYGRKLSYRELRDQVDRFATALADLGVKKGDKVALLLLNSPQFIIAYFGALKAGATLTPISPMYVSSEIKHQIEDSGARSIICQDILYEHVEKAGVKLDRVILTDVTEYLPRLKRFLGKSMLRAVYQKMSAPPMDIYQREGFYQFQDLLKGYPPEPPHIEFNVREDLVTLPYTGGTTGLPKGAMITHHNIVAAQHLGQAFWGDVMEVGKEIILAYLPFYHIYGQSVVMLGGISQGYTLVIFTTPDLDDILNSIESYRATIFYSVPSLYEALRDYARTDRVNWKRLKVLVSGADALLEDTARGWEQRTGTRIHEGWGMTETSSVGILNPYGRPKVGSFGIPLSNTIAAIVDPDGTDFLPVGEVGELLVRGPQVMKGYWNQSAETEEVLVEIDGEKWLRTSDLASMDEEGYFSFYDRKRDMIKYKGLAVFAREVEEVLANHPQVKEAGVIGVPDPEVGERVKAVVVLETEARGKVLEEEIIKYCQENLAHYKCPRVVEFRGEVPKTDVGKVSRRELRETEEL
ncbi:MAG: long-chain fatty acid--CoA ligase [Dehalococcoidales bacterium]|nr:long-chain fatty acid--CoA ligase [Dehalococcoidales bacterium]